MAHRHAIPMHSTSRVALFLPEDVYLSSLGAIIDVWAIANSFVVSQKSLPLAKGSHFPKSQFQVFGLSTVLLSLDGRPVRSTSGEAISVAGSLEHASGRYDCIFLPAFNFRIRPRLSRTLARYRPLYPWLASQRREGALIAANGASVFLLAEAGLLDGREATIGWWLKDDFRKRYPTVNLDSSKHVTDSNGVLCANTLSTALDLACRVLERIGAPPVAQMAAEIVFALSEEAKGLSSDGERLFEARDTLVAKAQFWLARNYASKPTLSQLAKYSGASERTLIRRFKEVLGMTPRTYLKTLRITNAKRLLAESSLTVPQIATQVGYEDVDFFKKSFKGHVGHSPAAFRSASRPEGPKTRITYPANKIRGSRP